MDTLTIVSLWNDSYSYLLDLAILYPIALRRGMEWPSFIWNALRLIEWLWAIDSQQIEARIKRIIPSITIAIVGYYLATSGIIPHHSPFHLAS